MSRFSETEERLQQKWAEEGLYDYKPSSSAEKFVIDTPPPTVSGDLHVGHLFSYTQTDILARFQRMLGKNVFYPMGWDDNGLPTERRVQNLYGVRCDPALDYIPDLSLERLRRRPSDFRPVSRRNFLELCEKQVQEDEIKYKKLWSRLGLSVDWGRTYRTISPRCQRAAQFAFLSLVQKGFAENRLSPVFWDTQFQTAVANADIEEREQKGFYYDIPFQILAATGGGASRNRPGGSVRGGGPYGGGRFVVSTTRPELLPACVAVAAHPEDVRYQKFFYEKALSPLFHAPVPFLPSTHADPEKGTGALMICTFGDMEDADFWAKHKLPPRQILNEAGFVQKIIFTFPGAALQASVASAGGEKAPAEDGGSLQTVSNAVEKTPAKKNLAKKTLERGEGGALFESLRPDEANKTLETLAGLRVKAARKKIAEILQEKGLLAQEQPQETVRPVKHYEKGDFPLEILLKEQWHIKVLEHKEALLEQGRKIQWSPPAMRDRYEQWTKSLKHDWCISRQRFYGVPFPVWRSLKDGKPDRILLPPLKPELLPVDPMKQAPPGFSEKDRGRLFVGDNQVMDTWAVSSLTPLINSEWAAAKSAAASGAHELFPADMRPQAHEIIRTWAFYTIVQSWALKKSIPWKHIVVSGWVVNPERAKLSKSKGNAPPLQELLDAYSADGIRYWAGRAPLGRDTVYDENIFKIGRRLAVKILNAGKFVSLQTDGASFSLKTVTEEIDKAWLLSLAETRAQATDSLKNFDYAAALAAAEKAFWSFCDNYLELVKARAYRLKTEPAGLSARAALDFSLRIFLKLFAPYLPYATDEVWRSFRREGEAPSIHSAGGFEGPVINPQVFCAEAAPPSGDFSADRISERRPAADPAKARPVAEGDAASLLQLAFLILEKVRSQKTALKKSLAAPLKELRLKGRSSDIERVSLFQDDLRRACHVGSPEGLILSENDTEGAASSANDRASDSVFVETKLADPASSKPLKTR